MVGENIQQTFGEQVAVDAEQLLQDRLGVTQEVAKDLTRILVKCPVPGVESEPQPLGEFIVSPHAEGNTDQLIGLAKLGLEKGDSPEEAIHRALGFAAVVDSETGNLVKAPEAEDPKKN